MAPVLGSVRAPLDLVPPHEILPCNNGQEEIRTAEILTRVDFIWAPSRSILKESNGIVERAPED